MAPSAHSEDTALKPEPNLEQVCVVDDEFDLTGLEAMAARLEQRADTCDVFALWGDLGSGKTTLARAFIRARARRLDCPVPEVPSPTFTLVQIYESPECPVWHMDLYRLCNEEEVWELGVEDAFGTAISVIEWPDRAITLLPNQRIDIALEQGSEINKRKIRITVPPSLNTRFKDLVSHG
jgi:tRNA threonylcarbamoyladenosine biosynthesis protein TsaE